MPPRRWLLLALSLGSLVILSYGAIAVAFSLPVTDEMAAANVIDPNAPETGQRAVVSPIVNGADVATHRAEPRSGAWLVVADRDVTIPASAENPSLVRALAYASVLHNRSYKEPTITLENLTASGPNGTYEYNVTVDLALVGDGGSGFLVKTASDPEVRFVPESRVIGQVARFESSVWVFALVGGGTLGFVAPLVALVLTARPTGRPGVPASTFRGLACAECRRPLPSGAEFCTACGALVPKPLPKDDGDAVRAR